MRVDLPIANIATAGTNGQQIFGMGWGVAVWGFLRLLFLSASGFTGFWDLQDFLGHLRCCGAFWAMDV
jgi:hypothetical protein